MIKIKYSLDCRCPNCDESIDKDIISLSLTDEHEYVLYCEWCDYKVFSIKVKGEEE